MLFCLLACSVMFVCQALYSKTCLLKFFGSQGDIIFLQRAFWLASAKHLESLALLDYLCEVCKRSVRDFFLGSLLVPGDSSLCPRPKWDSPKPYLGRSFTPTFIFLTLKLTRVLTSLLAFQLSLLNQQKFQGISITVMGFHFLPTLGLISSLMFSDISIYI